MSIYGIVSEFNPFHNGHKYLINLAKDAGAECIVCIMSGNTVERGEFAITDKYIRAEIAVECGADLVLELPFPWCSASAEYFAGAAVHILGFFADTVFFGSESGDMKLLSKAADFAADEGFLHEYSVRLNMGAGSAAAYFDLLAERGISKLNSNDILGIEYIKAAKKQSLSLNFKTVRRVGAGYLEGISEEKGIFQSASGIRREVSAGDLERVADFMPNEAFEILKKASEAGNIFEPTLIDKYILLFFALADAKKFSGIAETDGGVAERLISAAKKSKNTAEMLEHAATKRYTDSKLRRAVMFSLAGVKKQTLHSFPAYTNLLATNEKGRRILAGVRKRGGIKVVTKPADANRNAEQFRLGEKADILYSAGLKRPNGNMLKRMPYIK